MFSTMTASISASFSGWKRLAIVEELFCWRTAVRLLEFCAKRRVLGSRTAQVSVSKTLAGFIFVLSCGATKHCRKDESLLLSDRYSLGEQNRELQKGTRSAWGREAGTRRVGGFAGNVFHRVQYERGRNLRGEFTGC